MTVSPPASQVSVVLHFTANQRVADDYSLGLFLVDAKGTVVQEIHNNLSNSLTVLPTHTWVGPITLALSMPIPSIADGVYSLRVGMEGWAGLMRMTAGDGVVQDERDRYTVGLVRVKAGAPQPGALPPPSLDLAGYKLTFDDEFTEMSISDSDRNDGSRWYTKNEECCMQPSDGSGTAMVKRSSTMNPYSLLPDGGLAIRLQKKDRVWSSGVLTSVDNVGNGFSQQYGYFEMKARFPKGLDTWPAFWLLNTASKRGGSAGEIDIVEYIANPGFSDFIATTLHDWSDKTTPAASHYRVKVPYDDFHTYGMMWTPSTMTFYFDGAAMFEVPTPAVMHQPYYLLVDLGIGAGWPTEATPAINDLEIKYIRAYSK